MNNKADTIPGPRGRRLVGNTYAYNQNPLGFLRSCQQHYGDLFRYDPEVVVLSDPHLVREVLVRTNQDFSSSGTPILEPRAAPSDHEPLSLTARRRRAWRLVGQHTLIANADRLSSAIEEQWRALQGRPVELVETMQQLCTTVAVTYCLGPDCDITAAAAAASRAILSLLDTANRGPTFRSRHMVHKRIRVERALLQHLELTINVRRNQGWRGSPDALHALLEATDPASTSAVDLARIVKAALLGTRATTGAALAWAVRELANNPQILATIRCEVERHLPALICGDTKPLIYTRAFVAEILRFHPPVWLMARDTVRTVHLGKWVLPVGHRVLFSPYLIHHDPRWWHDPDKLLPERWLTASPRPTAGTYLPFGGGPHTCLGTHLGTTLLILAIAHLAAHHTITLLRDQTLRPPPHVLHVPHGCRTIFTSV